MTLKIKAIQLIPRFTPPNTRGSIYKRKKETDLTNYKRLKIGNILKMRLNKYQNELHQRYLYNIYSGTKRNSMVVST